METEPSAKLASDFIPDDLTTQKGSHAFCAGYDSNGTRKYVNSEKSSTFPLEAHNCT